MYIVNSKATTRFFKGSIINMLRGVKMESYKERGRQKAKKKQGTIAMKRK